MELRFLCPACDAEMFEGAHFCMACGASMTKGHDSPALSAATSEGPLELDEDWDDQDKGSADGGTHEVVPDEELEIEELSDTAGGKKGQLLLALRQVRDYLIELDLESRPNRDCLDVCRRVLGSLNGAGEALGQDVAAACQELARALRTTDDETGTATDSQLSLVKTKYNALATLVPELGDFEEERELRVKLVVRSILEEVPGLGPLGRSKLEAAGFADVQQLCLASEADLVAAGLAPELAARVSERVARFNRRLNSVPPQADRSAERGRLQRLTATLKEQNEKFETVADDWSKGATELRRKLRDERSETMSQVSLLLARLGELRAAERIERLPFDKKASELERLLGALDDTHRQSP